MSHAPIRSLTKPGPTLIRDALSWNRIPRVAHRREVALRDRLSPFPALAADETCLVFGQGRSYGDVCLNEGGVLLRARGMDHWIDFDPAIGRLRAEAGVLLGEILELITPQGLFLPVTPGTRFATLGGAIANDVHGKNHHVAGSFGRHVRRLELLRSDGTRIICGPDENADWFRATIGGLGLTGVILWAEIDLMRIANPFMVVEAQRFRTLDEFWRLNRAAESSWPYTVAWLDCTHREGRGVLYAGRHAPAQVRAPEAPRRRTRRVPFDPPFSLIGGPTLRAFNASYYRRPLPREPRLAHHLGYFYPLDGIELWNRLYGRQGFYQYQCVVPPECAADGVRALVEEVAKSGVGSFLSVLKTFGDLPSPGLLSFARPGATLALDFANTPDVHTLFARLDAIVLSAGGALYPAKDARMSPAMFRAGAPQLESFLPYVDPKFSSSFWRRVMETA